MDIKAYISSGILELYVLDQLPSEQRLEVEGYAEQYPEIKQELDNIEKALLLYSQKTAITPPPDLEASVMARIDEAEKVADNQLKEKPSLGSTAGRWIVPLLAVALLAAVGWGIFLFQKSNQQQSEIVELTEKMEKREIECAEKEEENRIMEEQLRFIRTGSNRIIRMKGTERSPQALATVYWNPDAQKTYLDINSMPEPPADKQYQLWAIVDGTPVDMGVFDINLSAKVLQEVPHIKEPAAFAVTLEPKGGSPSPTLTEMYVIGNVI